MADTLQTGLAYILVHVNFTMFFKIRYITQKGLTIENLYTPSWETAYIYSIFHKVLLDLVRIFFNSHICPNLGVWRDDLKPKTQIPHFIFKVLIKEPD